MSSYLAKTEKLDSKNLAVNRWLVSDRAGMCHVHLPALVQSTEFDGVSGIMSDEIEC